jgi:hypothetical protein
VEQGGQLGQAEETRGRGRGCRCLRERFTSFHNT